MATCYISALNQFTAAGSCTTTGRDSSTPATNAVDGRLATEVRADSNGATLVFKFDHTTPKQRNGLFLGNFTGDYLLWALSATGVDDEELQNLTPTVSLPAAPRNQMMVNLDSPITARYERIEMRLTGGIAKVGWLWGARADFAPAVGFDVGAKFGMQSRTLVQTTDAGIRYTDYKRPLFTWMLNFQHLSQAEAMEQAIDLDLDRDVRRPVLFVPHEIDNSNTNLNRETLLGTFAQIDPVDLWEVVAQYAKSYSIIEALAADETVAWT